LVGGSISLHSIYQGRERVHAAFERQTRETVNVIAGVIVNDLYSLDLRSLRRRLESTRVNPGIRQALVTDLDGVVLTDGTSENPLQGQKLIDPLALEMLRAQGWQVRSEESSYNVAGPVLMPDGSRVGHLYVVFSLDEPLAIIRDTTRTSFYITLICLGLGAILALVVALSFSRPIETLVQATKEIGAGKLDTRVTLRRNDELGVLADSINDMARDIETRHAELEQFAYVASHDLQEPLRMITSYTTLLAKRYQGKLDKDADEFISYAIDGAKRMHGLINDLLTYSRVGTRGKEKSPTNCETVLQTTLTSLNVAIEERRAVVTHDPLPTVMGDASQLGQLFQNLIGNGIKFQNSKPPVIHVSCKKEGPQWVFFVKDNGIGVDPQYAERIFVIFQRLHAREEYPGTGIGLAVCKKIVERHGGRIWVESKLGEGATFFFTIPAVAGEKERQNL